MALINTEPETSAFFMVIFAGLGNFLYGNSFASSTFMGSMALLFTIPKSIIDAVFQAMPILGPIAVILFLIYYGKVGEYLGESVAVAMLVGAVAVYAGA